MRLCWLRERKLTLSTQTSELKYFHTVQYYETDAMGIAHHSNYIRWAEEARNNFLYAIGYNWSKIEQESGIMIPVLSQSVEHKKAFCFGDVVKIYTRILYFNGVKIHFEYKFYSDSKDGIYALAKTKHGFVDKELHPIMLQSVLRSEYDNIIGYMNAIE